MKKGSSDTTAALFTNPNHEKSQGLGKGAPTISEEGLCPECSRRDPLADFDEPV
jgi:hypothetical protein